MISNGLLKTERVFLLNGKKDTILNQNQKAKLKTLYKKLAINSL
jgi:predicted esterase